MIVDILNTVAGWLAHPEVRAVLVGLVLSWGITQVIKNAPRLVEMSDHWHRIWTRVIAFLLASLPTVALWPGEEIERVAIGAAVGFASPVIYTYGARALYHFFPWLEPKMSAIPVVPKEPTE